jgi:hypothetical protein
MLGFLAIIVSLLACATLVTIFAMASVAPRPIRFSLKTFLIVLTLVALSVGLLAAALTSPHSVR